MLRAPGCRLPRAAAMGRADSVRGGLELNEPTTEDATHLVDLTGIALGRITRLCEAAARDLTPEDMADRPALRRALRRIEEEAQRSGGNFCRHSNGVF